MQSRAVGTDHCRRAAYQLEAAGKDSINLLLPGLDHPDREVRFYAAHALAYLNDPGPFLYSRNWRLLSLRSARCA